MEPISAVKGTADILPGDIAAWHRIEAVLRDVMPRYGYGEIRTPIFEETGLFARSIGEDTDIVGKEMYTFRDLGDRSLTLRPEGTASVVRAVIEHRLDQRGLPQKLWYLGPMFRQERPQKGRQRQFHQFGVEAVGSASPALDVEVMALFDDIAAQLGLTGRRYLVNCLGGRASRAAYRAALVSFLDSLGDRLCADCRRRRMVNPLRVLDCKVSGCREALDTPDLPKTVDYLTLEDQAQFARVQSGLNRQEIAHELAPSLVRGLDYYTGTVFEMQLAGLGAQSAVMGGGRYDDLVAELGGPDLPAVGFACGMERLILALGAAGVVIPREGMVQVVVAVPDGTLCVRADGYVRTLRREGWATDIDYLGRSLKSQMKTAGRMGAHWVLIVEPEPDKVSVKDMSRSTQETMPFERFLERLHEMRTQK